MRTLLLSFILVTAFLVKLHGQDYKKNAIGVRLGLSSGITYEHNVDAFRGYKGLLSFREGGIQITGLIESHRPLYLNFTNKMYYYVGMGAHVGYTRYPPQWGAFYKPFQGYSGQPHFAPVIGMDAIIGLEYRLSNTPLSFCLDAMPFFEFFGQNIFRLALLNIGFSIKILFN
jgi:hypothetical protein